VEVLTTDIDKRTPMPAQGRREFGVFGLVL
jgi:hypothetical protein